MLNIKYIYEDAINALENYSDYLEVPSVAITVYMLQQDVINSYKCALEHYFTISLSEPYLKNSSLGTPYQKWKHFTNENYISLSFSINNLLRYTSRLLHESELLFYENERRYEERTAKSNKYTGPICEIGYHDKFIGIRVLEGEQLELSKVIYGLKEFESEYSYSMTSTYGGESHYYKTLEDSTNLSAKIEISKQEFHEACAVVKSKIIDELWRSY